jgi:hypothetical protein
MMANLSLNQIYSLWIQRAVELNPGEKIFLEADSAKEQKRMERELGKEREAYAQVDPIEASKVAIRNTFKDRKHWVVIEKMANSPLVGFIKDAGGEISKITLGAEPEKIRRIRLMIADGYSQDKIEEIEGTLTEEELTTLGFTFTQEGGEHGQEQVKDRVQEGGSETPEPPPPYPGGGLDPRD